MKAVVYSEYGGPEVLRLAEVDKPAAAANEIFVKVHAASLNPADWHFMRGTPYPIRLGRGLKRPKSIQRLGFDYSGVVEAVGGSVTEFGVGDAVFGAARGACAEYVAVPVDPGGAVRKPTRLTFEQAAGVLIAGLTALQALRNKAQLQPGQQVLINGASGGVGTFAVQIAKAFGAEVTGVQSTRNLDLVRSLGADHLIDYTTDDFTTRDERYDVVLDNVGNRSLSEVRRVLKRGGTYLPNGGGSPDDPMPIGRIVRMLAISPFLSHRIRFFVASPNRGDLQVLAELMEAGKVTPVIDRCYPASEAAEGMRYLESGRARGKVVVTFA
jgi:NADPH:quinone reductase-like Zn-dependent oxidoreductase